MNIYKDKNAIKLHGRFFEHNFWIISKLKIQKFYYIRLRWEWINWTVKKRTFFVCLPFLWLWYVSINKNDKNLSKYVILLYRPFWHWWKIHTILTCFLFAVRQNFPIKTIEFKEKMCLWHFFCFVLFFIRVHELYMSLY